MRHSEAGKGSKRRPTDLEKFSNNWDAIFGKKVVIGEDVPPMTPEKIDELDKVLDQLESLPEYDENKLRNDQGLYRKFDVYRTDATDLPGGKHHGCEYFVLDVNHDKYAKAALKAYAEACREEYPLLAADIEGRML